MLNVVAPDVPVFRAALLGGVMATLGAPSPFIMAKNNILCDHFDTMYLASAFSWTIERGCQQRRAVNSRGIQGSSRMTAGARSATP